MRSLAQTKLKAQSHRCWMLGILGAILAVMAVLYEQIGVIEQSRQKAHQESFYEFVANNHLGTLTELDDGTGINPIVYELTLFHPLPDSAVASSVTAWFHQYWVDDHGLSLSVLEPSTKGHPVILVAQAHYDDDRHTLTLTVNPETDHSVTIQKKVDW